MKRPAKKTMIKLLYTLIIVVGAVMYSTINTYNFERRVRAVVAYPIDDLIPLIPAFIVPYIYWFAYIALSIVILYRADVPHYYRMLLSCGLTMAVSCAVFLLYPTYIPRGGVPGTGFFDACIRLLYQTDSPCNCLPSIHVGYSVTLCYHLFRYKKHSWRFHLFNFGSCLLICASTLFTKQHYMPDVVWGAAVGLSVSVLVELATRGLKRTNLQHPTNAAEKL